LGVDPKNIIFANPCKPVDFIKFSRSNDIDLLVVDSEYELHKIKLYHPEAKILIMIKTDDSKSKCKFNIKFGLELEQVKPLLILSNILAINIVGVSFHVGSGCQDANVYNKALSDTKEVFKIAEDLNIKMDIIDIGGGFPGTNDNNITFEDIVSVINKSIDELFYDKLDRIKFIAEPGRYFVSSSHTLVCSIINKKEYIENDEKKYIYYISDGLYGTFSGLMFDYAKVELLPFNERNEKRYNSIVFGPTCDSLDIVSKDCQLPSLAIGESIIIKNIGAYSIASGTEFNGFPKPDEYFILT
jgi:ornithine decarboxylase